MRRRLFIAAIAIVALAWAGLVIWATGEDGPQQAETFDGQPNVVLVIGCTLRRDMLSPYAMRAPKGVSPFIGRIAANGAKFSNAYAAAPWTKAASTALLTGYHPIQVGMIEPGPLSNRRRLSDEVTTLGEHLHGAGYETIGIVSNPNLNELFGFGQGFDDYVELSDVWREGQNPKISGQAVTEAALQAVDRRGKGDAPLFLRVMYVDAHAPITVPRDQVLEFKDRGSVETPYRVWEYRAGVRRFDDAVEKLWNGLRQRGFSKRDTLLVVVNDHGEGLAWPAKNQGLGHGNFTFQGPVGMPWIVFGSGVAQGHEIGGVASQVDVLPTLLGMVGVESSYDGPGQDWSAAVRGEVAYTTREHVFVDTHFQAADRAAVYTSEVACHRDGTTPQLKKGRKNSRMLPRILCHDNREDPYGLEPFDKVDVDVLSALDHWRSEAMATYEAFEWTDDALPSKATQAQLEALGYVDGDGALDGGVPASALDEASEIVEDLVIE